MNTDIEVRAVAEVRDVHQFLENWFRGTVARSEDVFAGLRGAWPATLVLVAPTGLVRSGADVLAQTWTEHGAFPSLRIEIRRPHATRLPVDGLAAVTYEEWHRDAAGDEGRLCSAVLVLGYGGGGRPLWLHIHESRLVVPGP